MKIKVLIAIVVLAATLVSFIFFVSKYRAGDLSSSEIKKTSPPVYVDEPEFQGNDFKKDNQVFFREEPLEPPKEEALDPVELIYSFDLWRDEHGFSDELMGIYDAMDPDTVIAIAEQGQDIYAMQSASYEFVNRGEDDLAVKILTRAAELGSINALLIIGSVASVYSEDVFRNPEDENYIDSAQVAFGLQDISDQKARHTPYFECGEG